MNLICPLKYYVAKVLKCLWFLVIELTECDSSYQKPENKRGYIGGRLCQVNEFVLYSRQKRDFVFVYILRNFSV